MAYDVNLDNVPLATLARPLRRPHNNNARSEVQHEAVNRMPLEPSWGADGDALILKELGAMFDTANLADAAVRRAHADDPNFSLIIPQCI